MSILEKLFYGEICTEEDFRLLENPEYQKLSEEINSYKDEFEKKLSHADYGRLNKMTEAYNASAGMENAYYFVYGFKLALHMAWEVCKS